jgi:hypothetical protein
MKTGIELIAEELSEQFRKVIAEVSKKAHPLGQNTDYIQNIIEAAFSNPKLIEAFQQEQLRGQWIKTDDEEQKPKYGSHCWFWNPVKNKIHKEIYISNTWSAYQKVFSHWMKQPERIEPLPPQPIK